MKWHLLRYTRLSPKSQLTIRAAILRALGWEPGTELVIGQARGRIIIRRAQAKEEGV